MQDGALGLQSAASNADTLAGTEAEAETQSNESVTERLAQFVVDLQPEDIPETGKVWARHALLDWSGVTLAARNEACVQILMEDLAGGDPQAPGGVALIGHGRRARLYDATLINGVAGHALDFDDVNPRLGGHPSVVVMPVALALGEHLGAKTDDVLRAIVTGFEVGCAVGAMTGTSHYAAGFHNTATIGTFAATATAAALLGLDQNQTRVAFGLAASQAAGLKCNFGTMTKPFHAGLAASNGLRAARLAQQGFGASTTAIEASQGFVDTQVPRFDPLAWRSPLEHGGGTATDAQNRDFGIAQTLFKFHAACYGTHGVLEAAAALRRSHDFALDEIEAIKLRVPMRSKGQCDQANPETGLALKFSTQHLAILALDGVDTAALETYTSEMATRADYAAVRERVTLVFEEDRPRFLASIELYLRDGRVLRSDGDVGVPAHDLDAQWQKLAAKFATLVVPIVGADRAFAAQSAITGLHGDKPIRALIDLIR